MLLMHISLALLTFICLNSIQNIFKLLSYLNQFFLLSVYNEAFCYRMPSSLDFSSCQDRAYPQHQIKNFFLANASWRVRNIYSVMHSIVFYLLHRFLTDSWSTLVRQCPLFLSFKMPLRYQTSKLEFLLPLIRSFKKLECQFL